MAVVINLWQDIFYLIWTSNSLVDINNAHQILPRSQVQLFFCIIKPNCCIIIPLNLIDLSVAPFSFLWFNAVSMLIQFEEHFIVFPFFDRFIIEAISEGLSEGCSEFLFFKSDVRSFHKTTNIAFFLFEASSISVVEFN